MVIPSGKSPPALAVLIPLQRKSASLPLLSLCLFLDCVLKIVTILKTWAVLIFKHCEPILPGKKQKTIKRNAGTPLL